MQQREEVIAAAEQAESDEGSFEDSEADSETKEIRNNMAKREEIIAKKQAERDEEHVTQEFSRQSQIARDKLNKRVQIRADKHAKVDRANKKEQDDAYNTLMDLPLREALKVLGLDGSSSEGEAEDDMPVQSDPTQQHVEQKGAKEDPPVLRMEIQLLATHIHWSTYGCST